MAVMIGTVEEDLQCLEIGPIVHSRLLTLACRILRYYTSFTNAPNKLAIFGRVLHKSLFSNVI